MDPAHGIALTVLLAGFILFAAVELTRRYWTRALDPDPEWTLDADNLNLAVGTKSDPPLNLLEGPRDDDSA